MGLIGLKTLIATTSLLLLSSCNFLSKEIKPKIQYAVQDKYLQSLASPFRELTQEEKETGWGMEYLIGQGFAKQLDLYRAITAFRRAEFLLPGEKEEQMREIQYQTLLAYYLGRRFQEVEKNFSENLLSTTPADSPIFHDLLVILYDTYTQLKETEKADHILQIVKENFSETYENLTLYTALNQADIGALSVQKEEIETFLKTYESEAKSPKIAAGLNAILPGAGYFYLGQISTAVTALIVNALFIFAAIHFFRKRPIAVAIIFLSFELGWYFGGIQGGGLGAKLYNERKYESLAKPIMNKHGLFPIYQLKYGF